MTIKIYFFVILCFLSLSPYAFGNDNTERILKFHSDIKVDTTGRVEITETIQVRVRGNKISQGIVRTLPFYTKNNTKTKDGLDIRVLSVKRNGEDEQYSTRVEGGDLAVYIGKAGYTLAYTIYTYTLVYETYGDVRFFYNYDEIYWNVTGNDWAFPIDSVSATVHVPIGAKVLTNSCYTGAKNSKATNCMYTVDGDSIVNYKCSTYLGVREGFTIATSFTPHFVRRPGIEEPPKFFRIGNIPFFILPFIFFFVLKYLKNIVNKNTSLPLVIPTFNPPENKSAVQLRYLYYETLDLKSFAASLIALAVKGAIIIKQEKKRITFIKESTTDTELASEEKLLIEKLFPDNEIICNIQMNASYWHKFQSWWISIYGSWKSVVAGTLNLRDYFLDKTKLKKDLNKKTIVLLVFWTFFLGLLADNKEVSDIKVLQTSLAFFIISYCIILRFTTKQKLFLYIKKKISQDSTSLYITAIAVVLASYITMTTSSLYFIVIIANILISKFYQLRNERGAKMLADIEGFRMYLKVTEENKLNLLMPPNQTPELFEKMLPYAVALDLEIEWTEKFSEILEKANYNPSWYVGKSTKSYTEFTGSLSQSLVFTLNRTMYRSSSSGSRGGGSSGGGSRGGGGRGW